MAYSQYPASVPQQGVVSGGSTGAYLPGYTPPLNPPQTIPHHYIEEIVNAVRSRRLDVTNATPVDLINMRLTQGKNFEYEGLYPPYYDKIQIHAAYALKDEWVVFVTVGNETAHVLRDDLRLFPSDALITALWLLIDAAT